jgi:hypothetical protein
MKPGSLHQARSGASRRQFIAAGAASVALTTASASEVAAAPVPAQVRNVSPLARTVKALTFDVFGSFHFGSELSRHTS